MLAPQRRRSLRDAAAKRMYLIRAIERIETDAGETEAENVDY